MKPILLFIATLGLFLFGSLFFITYKTPEVIKVAAQNFIKTQAKKEVIDILESQKLHRRLSLFSDLTKGLGITTNKDSVQFKINRALTNFIEVIAAYEQKENSSKILNSPALKYLHKVKINNTSLKVVATEKYQSVIQGLQTDIRIFSGCNFILFLILLILSFAKPKMLKALFFPALLLLFAMVISTLIYVFGQNWIYVLLYNKYIGFGYLIYVAVIFFFLCDIAFFKATFTRIVLEIIARVLNAFSGFLSI